MGADWTTLALYWNGAPAGLGAAQAAASQLDPIFGRSVSFYFFTLPAWRLIAGWLTTLAIIALLMAIGVGRRRRRHAPARRAQTRARAASPWRVVAFAAVLLAFALQVYLSRFARIYQDHVIFSGVGYTDASIGITGLLVVSFALVLGAVVAAVNAIGGSRS